MKIPETIIRRGHGPPRSQIAQCKNYTDIKFI